MLQRVVFATIAFFCIHAEAAPLQLDDFLSNHVSDEKVVRIRIEPRVVFFESGRNAQYLNFDFALEGLTDKELTIRFIKAGVYDAQNNLLTFRYLNHNAAETPGIETIGRTTIKGKDAFDVYNPFFEFPKDLDISYLRYTFTFFEKKTKKEYYYGDLMVRPLRYTQKVQLTVPLKGLAVITDGHDFYSHHRRFGMTVVRSATQNAIAENFGRYSLDFTHIGPDGNMRAMEEGEKRRNYDFHITNVKKFYSYRARVYAPADGEVVDVVDGLEDLTDGAFDFEKALKQRRVKDLAGNMLVIRHNAREFSHLFHLAKGSVLVKVGQTVKRGQGLGQIGFSGAATTYAHLHYQLMNGKDFLKDEAVPFQFSKVTLMLGPKKQTLSQAALDTGDVILSE
jgi:hypothetical protein